MMLVTVVAGSVLTIGGLLGARALSRATRRRAETGISRTPRWLRVTAGLISLGSIVAGPVLLITTLTGLATQREDLIEDLRESGTKATATINHLEETGTYYNHRPEMEVWLTVKPEGAPQFDAQARWPFSIGDVQNYRPGAKVRVLFDPQDHTRVAVVGVAVARGASGNE